MFNDKWRGMFTNVSWGSYFTGVALLCLAWYIYVGLRYYRQEISIFLNPSKKKVYTAPESAAVDNFFIEPTVPVAKDVELEDDFFKDVDHLIGHIKKTFSGAREKKANKDELNQYIGLLLKEYPHIKDSAFRSQINEIITTEDIGGNYFSQAEVDQLW